MSIEITVRLFATLRQEAGWSATSVQLPEGATLSALLATLEQPDEGVKLSGRPVYAAVNRAYASPEQILHEGDAVALFPPVSGGCSRRRIWV